METALWGSSSVTFPHPVYSSTCQFVFSGGGGRLRIMDGIQVEGPVTLPPQNLTGFINNSTITIAEDPTITVLFCLFHFQGCLCNMLMIRQSQNAWRISLLYNGTGNVMLTRFRFPFLKIMSSFTLLYLYFFGQCPPPKFFYFFAWCFICVWVCVRQEERGEREKEREFSWGCLHRCGLEHGLGLWLRHPWNWTAYGSIRKDGGPWWNVDGSFSLGSYTRRYCCCELIGTMACCVQRTAFYSTLSHIPGPIPSASSLQCFLSFQAVM